MISVICCYNNKAAVQSMLCNSLKYQDTEYETVLVDNTQNTFKSAAQALNHGFNLSRGEYIIFAHQDIIFEDKNFLNDIVEYIDFLDGESIIGAAGIKEKKSVYSNITHGNEQYTVGKYRVTDPVKIQTLDEVLIGVKRSVFQKLYFDDTTCDNWHLYGVDLCLSAKKIGIDSYVIPIVFHHNSGGNVNKGYMDSLSKVVRKHKSEFKQIHTTISSVNTLSYQKSFYNLTYYSKKYWRPKLKKIILIKETLLTVLKK